MKIKTILWCSVLSSMAAAFPLASAADVEIKTDRDASVRAETDREKVRASDKASGIIGMEVRNRQNEKLGEIKDLVLDLNSGKVSYAVLAVGGFIGLGEKLIALPPNALEASNDRGHLILDADKSKIQAAPGFAATAWPSLNDPQIHNYWKASASGAPAQLESGKAGVEVDVDVDRDDARIEGEVKTKKDKIYTDAEEDKK